ncbi:thiamin pyrophosphokinase 1 [Microplitis demolitor]|uniref:thiamin pyrophosphokinase 1 n=1 Tax=Microplitis demolitor TaxID=69319 RepID=UPI0004CCA5FE|nr:thiamin pyrophosphokinase 1 [Microplitis demolitor]XP_008544428.1 thiamin pyrophosphokinase 1 [Microplitis demolitor]XP_008544429.1 thiamin pyrophosphokinase 1 [Microplitis demolitor]XP_014296950.1 thiamin pyrophosphokinase 1 [Microplitis demolitor]
MQNETKLNETLWDPTEIFTSSVDYKYAIIILNQPILFKKNIVLPLWKKAQFRITVDGGANQWLKYLGTLADEIFSKKCIEYAPDLITGDFDSILPDHINKLKNVGVEIITTMDQNHTDFTKSLMQLSTKCKHKDIQLKAVYVFVETAGRFDHIMGNINTLYRSKEIIDVETIIQVASNSLTWLLKPGYHIIKIPQVLRRTHSWVGLIPIGSVVKTISTTGLKYNLDKHTLAFGDLVSTSNTYDGSPEVTVTTDSHVIWTMGIESLVELENDSL